MITQAQIDEAIKGVEGWQPEIDWGYDCTFSTDDIDKMLDGKMDDALDGLLEYNIDYIADIEYETAAREMKDAGMDEDDDDWDDAYNKVRDHVVIDVNLRDLFKNTRVAIGIMLDASVATGYYGFEYDDFREILTILKINPRRMNDWFDFSPKFPNYPWRDGKEVCDIKGFIESVANSYYTGTTTIMLANDIDLRLLCDNIEKIKSEGFTLLPMSGIVHHDFFNGSSSTQFWTNKEVFIKPGDIKSIYQDGGWKYGISSCYGDPGFDMWDAQIRLKDGTVI